MKNFLFIIASIVLFSCTQEKRSIRVACIGDSITEGYGLKVQSMTGYPRVLDSLLGDQYTVLNAGRSATTLRRGGDFPYWIAKEFTNVFAFEPDIVVIKLGTNDTKPRNWDMDLYRKDYQTLIDTLQGMKPAPKVYLCTPAPVFNTRWGINDSTVVNGVLPVVREMAEKNQLPVIDFYGGLQDQATNFPDDIHPNEAAAYKMAEIAAKALAGGL